MLAIRSKGNPFGSARVRDPAKERFTTLAEQCEACSGFANLIAFMNRQGRRGLQAQLVGTPAPPLLQFRCEFCKRIRALCAGLRELSCYKFFASRQDILIVTSQLDRPDIGSLAKLIVGLSNRFQLRPPFRVQ